MQLTLRHELAFVTATLTYSRPTDTLRRLRGVGGHEHVFTRRVDRFAIGDRGLDDFELEIGEMDYGFEIGGILGMDFLRAAGAVIDLDQLTITFS